jgi:hypothetical protein
MGVEFRQMLMPFLVATVLFFASLLVYGTAIHLIVGVMVRLIRRSSAQPGYWKSTAVMAIATAITAAAHLTQIALWASAFLLCGQASTFETAFYLSAQSYTAVGYGDVLLSERWRILGPLEATNGLLFFGLSTAVLFAIMSRLIARRLRIEIRYRGEAAGDPASVSVVRDARSRRTDEGFSAGR